MSSPRHSVILTDEAQDDLQSIALHGLLTWGEQQAERYHTGIADVLDSLARFPRMGRRKEDLAGEVRTIGVGHHSILYRLEQAEVVALRILHARMDASHHLDL